MCIRDSVSSAGDFNGDGYSDVIVGAYGYDAGSTTNIGRAYIFYGGSSADNTADVIMTGEATNDYFGRSVSSAGDLNGDGYSDVIVGAYVYGASDNGRTYLYLGGGSPYYPVFNFANKAGSACSNYDYILASWNGQSSIAASTNNIVMQAYNFGTICLHYNIVC